VNARTRDPELSGKLTREQVEAIRKFAEVYDMPKSHLAAAYGVTELCIRDIVNRKTWNKE
jgi:hypothetical protein